MKDKEFIFKTMKDLCKKLNVYRNEYYNSGQPLVSDQTYDDLYDKLEELEKATGVVFANSPTRTVGYSILEGKEKVKHPFPLLSMQKTKDIKEFGDYFKGKMFVFSLKLDGLTTELLYEEGHLRQASTRGNGEVGEDITELVQFYTNIPLSIPFTKKLRIVGESIIKLDDFEALNDSLSETERYANARNLVSGSLGLLDTQEFEKRKVNWFGFNVLEAEGKTLTRYSECLKFLGSLGFDVCPHVVIRNNDIEEEVERLCENAKYLKIGIDGLVGKFEDLEYGKSLGTTSHHPLDSMAFKFYDETFETILRGIEWQTSKDGRLFPRAMFDTVVIDGAEVSFATLHNIRYIKELKLGEGDKILVSKRNQIIPAIEKNLTCSNTYTLPTRCPSCGHDLRLITISNTDYLICENSGECRAQKSQFFKRLVSRDALNVEGVSEATIDVLLEKDVLDTPKDLWDYTHIKSCLKTVEGFGEKSISNIILGLEKARNTTLSNFIYALSIPLIGKVASRTIGEYFNGDIKDFLDKGETFEYTKLNDFGDSMNKSIKNFLKANKLWIKDLADILNFSTTEEVAHNDFLEGKTFCVTGSFNTLSRKDIEKLIVEGGGKLTGSVSKNTDFLLTNDKESGSSKNNKAKELGTPILSEEEFFGAIERGEV